MVATNNRSMAESLTSEQLGMLQQRVGPYLAQVRLAQAQIDQLAKAIGDIAGSYLEGLGLDSTYTIDLSTGRLTKPLPVAVTE